VSMLTVFSWPKAQMGVPKFPSGPYSSHGHRDILDSHWLLTIVSCSRRATICWQCGHAGLPVAVKSGKHVTQVCASGMLCDLNRRRLIV